MDDAINGILEGYDPYRYPDELLRKYEPVECLSHNQLGETLLVKEYGSGKYCIAKCYLKEASLPCIGENTAIKSLSHEGIPAFINEYENGVMICVLREYAPGVSLAKFACEKALSQEQVVSIGVQLCDILTYLHRQTPPIIHRDIKPQNIIVNEEGRIKLIDFGISRTYDETAKNDTMYLGTMEFAPPEQYGFAQTDNRADIFSFGMVLCYLMTGETAVKSSLEKIKNKRLVRIIKKCTAFAPEQRLTSAERVKAALLGVDGKHRRQTACISLASVLLLIALSASSILRYAAGIVQFEEPLIEQAIHRVLGKEAGEHIKTEELSAITELYIFGNKVAGSKKEFNTFSFEDCIQDNGTIIRGEIASLSDIAKLENLSSLSLVLQNISDITPLAKLHKLESLELKHNPISDITPLSSLSSLRSLFLYDTYVSDLSPLSSCLKLTDLDIGRTNVTSPDVLVKLYCLERLMLRETAIASLQGFETFPRLTELYISQTRIRDLTPLLSPVYLQQVEVDETMREAVQEIAGQAQFEIIYK